MGRPLQSIIRPGGSGLDEARIHPASGLRINSQCPIQRTNFARISGAAAQIGGAAGAPVEVWTPVVWTSFEGRVPVPQTPCILVLQAVAAATQIRFRVRGLDQFGATCYELTPWVTLDADIPNTGIPLSKVFSWVGSVEYMSIGVINTTNITIGISNLYDPGPAADDAESPASAVQMINTENLGLGTMLRISPYGRPDPFPHPEVIGMVMAYNFEQTEYAEIPPQDADNAGFTVGRNVPGWQGTPHKIGFASPDGWTTKIAGGSGEFRMGGQEEGVLGSPPRMNDTLQFSFHIRSELGTRRDALSDGSYAR